MDLDFFPFYLANTGGLLGLFMGFSVISLIEILYFITFRPYCDHKRKHKKSAKKLNGKETNHNKIRGNDLTEHKIWYIRKNQSRNLFNAHY